MLGNHEEISGLKKNIKISYAVVYIMHDKTMRRLR